MKKTKSVNKNIHTISFLVANKPGVLVRVALVFARRAFNIDSLVVSPSFNPNFSRMTITASGDIATLDQIIKQANKLVDVVHAEEHDPGNAVEKELALVKLKYKPGTKAAITKLMKKYHAKAGDTTDSTMIIEQTGTTEQLDAFESSVKKYGIIEMVRTGKILMARGKDPT